MQTVSVPLHLAYAPSEVSVASGHDVALVLSYSFANAVICVGAFVRAGYPLNPGILHGTHNRLNHLHGKSVSPVHRVKY